ncbi:DUF86 domain-containing protein [Salisediminibacterium beveridgei]|uniref:DUF86 domain-containing protein n=1 Tax=Salisediminibacterium beveridgei TaxID=632773 RepID=A0A1D7QSN6_9BACI|nr:DUF86 domain-containing protein [Salisediminibacterium beveridgei]AOM82026.1 hypothetical protein BBEV_0635 [Salisediminibacterium beveridgei]
MYFVDLKLLEKRLSYYEDLLAEFSKVNQSDIEKQARSIERITHMMLEVMMDVGNQMIDGFIMRDPGSYEDIVEILQDEKVLTKENGKSIKKLIPWRKVLLQQYTELDTTELYFAFKRECDALMQFSTRIRAYIDQEMGPVSAFLPQKE